MCKDIAPEQMESYLGMLDRAEALEVEVEEALGEGRGNLAGLAEAKEFLAERLMFLEAMAGAMSDTYILVTPYAELLRGLHGE